MERSRIMQVSPVDLNVLLTVVRKSSFAAAAAELGVSSAYVSKRIRVLEEALRTRLLHRTTRRITLTEDGQLAYQWAIRILSDFDSMYDELSASREHPHGSLHICSTFGFGREHVGPALSALHDLYPDLRIRLDLVDRVVDIIGEGFDMEIRIGNDLSENLIARHLAKNHRILCASPEYLKRRGYPETLDELLHHECIILKERNNSFGQWTLYRGETSESVSVRGPLSSNSGSVVLKWALDGHGIILRSRWEVGQWIEEGRLVHLLPQYQQPADIWAVYQTRLSHSAKVKVCVEFLEKHFQALVSTSTQ